MKKMKVVKYFCIIALISLIGKAMDIKDVYAYFMTKAIKTREAVTGQVDFKVIKSEIKKILNEENGEYISSQEIIVENVGSSDILLRINIEPIWINEEGNIFQGDISLIKYSVVDKNYGNIVFGENEAEELMELPNEVGPSIQLANEVNKEGQLIGVENQVNRAEESMELANEEGQALKEKIEEEIVVDKYWINGQDGYLYFNSKLKEEEKVELIINYEKANMPENLSVLYENKNLHVNFAAEIVQCTKDAYRKVWNCNDDINFILDSLCDF